MLQVVIARDALQFLLNNLLHLLLDAPVICLHRFLHAVVAVCVWKSHATLTLLATQDLPTFGYNMIDPLKSWCWGSILFYPFKISRFS